MRRQQLAEGEIVRLPTPPAPDIAAGAFMPCPFGAAPAADPVLWLCQQALYRWALEQAEAVARPSVLERDLVGAWN